MEPDSESSSTTVTLRIDTRVLEKLKNHSKYEKLTLNAMVNKLLSHSINWDVTSSKSHWVPIEGSVLAAILGSLDESTIIDIAKMAGRETAKDVCLSMTGNFGVNEWVSILNLRSKAAGFSVSHIDERDTVTYIMKHDMGMKCSLHWKTFYEYGFKQLGCPATFEMTENTVVYKIPKKYLSN
jgi:hypothetical protein